MVFDTWKIYLMKCMCGIETWMCTPTNSFVFVCIVIWEVLFTLLHLIFKGLFNFYILVNSCPISSKAQTWLNDLETWLSIILLCDLAFSPTVQHLGKSVFYYNFKPSWKKPIVYVYWCVCMLVLTLYDGCKPPSLPYKQYYLFTYSLKNRSSYREIWFAWKQVRVGDRCRIFAYLLLCLTSSSKQQFWDSVWVHFICKLLDAPSLTPTVATASILTVSCKQLQIPCPGQSH